MSTRSSVRRYTAGREFFSPRFGAYLGRSPRLLSLASLLLVASFNQAADDDNLKADLATLKVGGVATDNTDLLLLRAGLGLLRDRVVGVIDALARFALQHRSVPTPGFTHFQPAQLTTISSRERDRGAANRIGVFNRA